MFFFGSEPSFCTRFLFDGAIAVIIRVDRVKNDIYDFMIVFSATVKGMIIELHCYAGFLLRFFKTINICSESTL